LKAFVELYCDIDGELEHRPCIAEILNDNVAVEDRVFSIGQPSAFFTMYGSVGGVAASDLAIEAFEDDLKLTGRSVSLGL
jgi:hypothetical protein